MTTKTKAPPGGAGRAFKVNPNRYRTEFNMDSTRLPPGQPALSNLVQSAQNMLCAIAAVESIPAAVQSEAFKTIVDCLHGMLHSTRETPVDRARQDARFQAFKAQLMQKQRRQRKPKTAT